MITLSAQEGLLLITLLLCVPLQMWLQSRHIDGTTQDVRDGKMFAVVREVQKGIRKYMSTEFWYNCYATSLYDYYPDEVIRQYALLSEQQVSSDISAEGECPAVEVIRQTDPEGYYTGSTEQRKYRTSYVQFRIGQVVKHPRMNVRGVIVGWDETCRAPPAYFEKNYEGAEKNSQTELPHYAVFVDTKDVPIPVVYYIAQADLELANDQIKVDNPDMHLYFDDFDGSRHIPRKWLSAIYPED